MHEHFEYIIKEIAQKDGIESAEVIDSLRSTVEHAARQHLHLSRDIEVAVAIEPATGEVSVLVDGNPVAMDDLGKIHRTDIKLNL